MRTLFKITLLMLITSVAVNAQKYEIINKSFNADKKTTAIFNIDYSTLAIEESTDGKIHINYTMEFEGYSKKKIKVKLEEINVKVSSYQNHVTVSVNSISSLADVQYEYNDEGGRNFYMYTQKNEKDSITRKSKDSLLTFIKRRNGIYNNSLKFVNNKFKKVDKNGKLVNIKGSNLIRSKFVIKIPPYIKLTINGKQSKFFLKNDFRNEFVVDLKGGYIRAKQLYNNYNRFKIKNVAFEAEDLTGGDYTFINVNKGYIGSLRNVKINSEFSYIEIGEIQNKTTISDFNSEYYLYNWSKDFKRFNLYSEYSKIHFFYPKSDYSFKVFGNNTKHIVGKNFVANFQPNKNGEKYNMMEHKVQGIGDFSGNIYFDIVHGIIYAHEDTMSSTNN